MSDKKKEKANDQNAQAKSSHSDQSCHQTESDMAQEGCCGKTADTKGETSSCSTTSCCLVEEAFSRYFPPNVNDLVSVCREVLLNPKNCWGRFANDALTIKDVYGKYIIWLALIPAVCGFVRQSLLGFTVPFIGLTYRVPFFKGLSSAILQYGFQLLLLYVGALVVAKISPKFSGREDLTASFKLLAYSSIPGMLAACLQLFSLALASLGMAFSLYGLYILFHGIPKMTGVPEERRWPFLGVIFLVMIAIGIILHLLQIPFAPKTF
ncbi:MAG TPA: Yip1 family protein [Oligoflexia bacterium]|nr:Yip1 family protein [Oligoflexia bacterium]HMP26714.1 Yip1 family protein [Oligoflexia bacterium]